MRSALVLIAVGRPVWGGGEAAKRSEGMSRLPYCPYPMAGSGAQERPRWGGPGTPSQGVPGVGFGEQRSPTIVISK